MTHFEVSYGNYFLGNAETGVTMMDAIRQEHEAELARVHQDYQGKLNAINIRLLEAQNQTELLKTMFQQDAAEQVEASKTHYERTAAQVGEIANAWKLKALKANAELKGCKMALSRANTRLQRYEKAVRRCLAFGATMTAIAVLAIAAILV